MPFARSSRYLRPERTPCPHCGRDNQTSSDGVCVECWGRKREGRLLFPSYRRDRGWFRRELDDFVWSGDVLWVLAAVSLIVFGIFVAVR